jgi:hypothetical protein
MEYSLDGCIHIVQPEDTVLVRGPLLITRKADGTVFCELGDRDDLIIELDSLKPGDASTYQKDGAVTTFIMSMNGAPAVHRSSKVHVEGLACR